ncbi:MAG: nucleotidyltransferase family protein [Nitrospirota bacterium]
MGESAMIGTREIENEEQKVILSLSVANPSGEALSRIRELMQDKKYAIDFVRILECAAANEVATICYENLRTFDNVPLEITVKLRNAYLRSVRNNVLNSEEMLRILRSLAKGGVEAIPLKGSLASELIFGNPGIYPATDIDILVRPGDLERAETIVVEAGYSKNEGLSDEDLLLSHYHLVYRKDSHFLELHWNLAKRYYHIPPDFWWEESRRIDYAGISLNILSPERYLMYAIFRLFDHGFKPLKFFVFVSRLIQKYEKEIDWEKFRRLSGTCRMERLTVFTLQLVHELFRTQIPDDILRIHVRGYEYFKKRILAGIFGGVGRPHFQMFLYTFLLDTPGEFAKVMTKRFFPGMGEIRLRYGLPSSSKKAYAYYLLNPIMVFLKKR